MKKVESRENEFVEQLNKLLTSSFPPQVSFKTKYFIGEDTDSKKRGLYFELSSINTGLIYSNLLEIKE